MPPAAPDLESAPALARDPALEATLDAAVAHLRTLHHTAVLAHALDVGKYLLDTFFAGDVAVFHDGTATDHASFEALVTQRRDDLEDLGLSTSALRNYVRAWEVWSDLPHSVRDRLELSHLVRLARVDPITRSQLAFRAAEDGWPVRHLERAIDEHADRLRTPGRGRPPLPEPVKAWGQVFSATRDARKLAATLGALPPKHLARLRHDLEATVAELQATLAALPTDE